MYLFAIGFVVGNGLIQSVPTLPDFISVSLLVLISLPLLLFNQLRSSILGLIVGALLTLWSAYGVINSYLPVSWISKNLMMQGIVDDVPHSEAGIDHFTFKILQITTPDGLIDAKVRRVQLSLKTEQPLVHAGEKWQLMVRLKPIRGNANPGSFDAEKWSFSQRLIARGYVVNTPTARKLADPSGIYRIQWWREKAASAMIASGAAGAPLGILQALTIGVKNHIPNEVWQNLSKTGTSHLVAISGLHIGLVAGMLGWLCYHLWIKIPRAPLLLPAQKVAAIGSLVAAISYSALAGFSIPTQRTVAMVLVGCLSVLLERPLLSWQTFCVALLAVLCWDPLASLTIGFWLSFGAVAFILLGAGSQLHQTRSWRSTLLTQKAVFIGLIPLSIYFFDGFSLISPVANGLAIPYVSIIVVPIALLGVLLALFSNTLAVMMWKIATVAIQGLLIVLNFLAQSPVAYVHLSFPEQSLMWIISATIATIVLLTRAIPHWYLSCFAFLPLLLNRGAEIAPNTIKLSLLDVGQGLSVVIQTSHHVLLYDTGASFLSGGSFAESVILPFLQRESIQKLDALVLSHADNDHAGGASALLAHIRNDVIYQNQDSYPGLTAQKSQLCQNGQQWQWDGVDFEFINPLAIAIDGKRNDKSCVLRVAVGEYSVLLPGDIERFAEKVLIAADAHKVATTVLVSPHHGSRTSSHEDFIRAAMPKMILISAGYRNRYRLPSKLVVERYQKWQIPYLETARSGTIAIHLNQRNGIYLVTPYRSLHQHYWTYRED